MRRRWAPRLLLLLLALGLGSAVVQAQGGADEAPAIPNHLRNESFAAGGFWIFRGDARFHSDGRTDSGSAYLSSPREYDSEIVQTVGPQLVPGRRYTVTAWVRALSEDAVAVIGVRWEGGHPRVFRGVRPEDGWTKVEFRFTAPEEPGWRQVVLSGTGTLVWDDIGLFEADSLEARLAASWERRLADGEPIFTGLVVNALGTNLQRGMSPRIYDPSGTLIFAGIGAPESQIYTEGIVAYATDLGTATAHPRLEVSDIFPLRIPLVVDAQEITGLPATSVIVGEADAKRIREAAQRYDFFGRFAVVFVVEPFAGF